MPAVKGMTAYQFARMNEIERMPKQQPDTFNEVKKNVGNQLTNASVGAFVVARESFDIVQNYMDAAVGVVGQVANGTINDPIKSKFAFLNPFIDFAEGVKNMPSGSNLHRLGGSSEVVLRLNTTNRIWQCNFGSHSRYQSCQVVPENKFRIHHKQSDCQ